VPGIGSEACNLWEGPNPVNTTRRQKCESKTEKK